MEQTLRHLAIIPLLSSTLALAQVPNGSFEQWTDFGTYSDPEGWTSLNGLVVMLGGEPTCEAVSPGVIGAKALMLTTEIVPGMGMFPGMLLSGSADAEVDGFPYTARPASLDGQWKADLATGDQASVIITLSVWNNDLGEREVIGMGMAELTSDQANWTAFSAAITYVSAASPDTASITILSGNGGETESSTLWVDALTFGNTVGVEEGQGANVLLYPQPMADVLNLVVEVPVRSVELWSADGRLVRTERPGTERVSLPTADLPAGAYVLVARMADATVLRRTVVK